MTSPFETADASKDIVDDSGVKRDRWGRYLLPPLRGGKDKGWTRATTFAKSISDTYVLSQWGARMAIKGLASRPDLYALTASTPVDDRDKLNGIVETCKEVAGAKVSASLGTALHSFTEAADRGEKVPSGPWDPELKAYRELVSAAGLLFYPELIERIVVVERYGVAGTFDRIARLTRPMSVRLPGGVGTLLPAGAWVVVDLKTGRDLTYGMNEIAIQLAMYANADAMWDARTGEYEPIPEVDRGVALVIHLPVGEGKAELIAVDIEQGWEAAKLCASVRDWRKVRKLSTVVAVSEPGSARPATWEERIKVATSKAELSLIWKAASEVGQWTPALAELGRQQLSKFVTA
jgi:hypothetical protein